MTLLLEMSVESSVRNRGGEGESGMMIYKRAKAWEWSVGRDVWSGGRKGRKEKKRKKEERQTGRKEERRASGEPSGKGSEKKEVVPCGNVTNRPPVKPDASARFVYWYTRCKVYYLRFYSRVIAV